VSNGLLPGFCAQHVAGLDVGEQVGRIGCDLACAG
jgi:hypothetical protein